MGHFMDIYQTEVRYEHEKEKLAATSMLIKNRNSISEFLRRMEIEGISHVQLVKYTLALRQLLTIYKKDFRKIKTDDIEKYLLLLKDRAPKTKTIRFYSLKKFFQFIKRAQPFAKIKLKNGYKLKMPDEILTEEEIERIIEAANKHKTFIAVLYESGCRISELLTLRKENVSFDEFGAVLQVNGKTGQRRIRIVKYAHLLKEQISKQRDLVFSTGYENALLKVKSAARAAGIQKRVYPHLFRHSRATHLAKALTEQELKVFFGWVGGSKMAGIYVHLCGKDIDKKLLELNGIQTIQRASPQADPATFFSQNPAFQQFVMQKWEEFQQQRTLNSFSRIKIAK